MTINSSHDRGHHAYLGVESRYSMTPEDHSRLLIRLVHGCRGSWTYQDTEEGTRKFRQAEQ